MKWLMRINGGIADPYPASVIAEMVEYGEAVFWRTISTKRESFDYYVLAGDDRA